MTSNKRIMIFIREPDVIRSYHDACKQKRQVECIYNHSYPRSGEMVWFWFYQKLRFLSSWHEILSAFQSIATFSGYVINIVTNIRSNVLRAFIKWSLWPWIQLWSLVACNRLTDPKSYLTTQPSMKSGYDYFKAEARVRIPCFNWLGLERYSIDLKV